MIDSFKEFFVEMYYLEMARPIEGNRSAVYIFDEHDRAYFGYIYNYMKQHHSDIFNDRDLMIIVFSQAICARYGRNPDKGDPTRKNERGKLLQAYNDKQMEISHTFNVKKKVGVGRMITVPNIPFNPNQVVEKILKHGWKPGERDFGYAAGNCSSGMKPRASEFLTYFETLDTEKKGKEPSMSAATYHSRRNDVAVDATPEEIEKGKILSAKSVKKSNIGDRDEFTVQSDEKIPLDEEDDKFLADIEARYNEELKNNPNRVALPLESVKRLALAKRYSREYVDQDENGKFVPASNISMRGNITVGIRRPITLKNVRINVPHLVSKFERYKLSRNFVTRPMDSGRDHGVQTAALWLKSRKHDPRAGLTGTVILPDREFYDQIFKDHERWRKGIRQSNPVPPELEKKLTWRRGNEIVEPPNIPDTKRTRSHDPNSMSWEELMKRDAEIGVNGLIGYLHRAGKLRGFEKRIQENTPDMIQKAFAALTALKTGVSGYREEANRIKWAGQVASAEIDKLLGQRTQTGQGKDVEMPSQIDLEPTRSQDDTGLNTRTGMGVRPDEPEPEGQFAYQTDRAYQLPNDYFDEPGDEEEVAWGLLTDREKQAWASMTPKQQRDLLAQKMRSRA